MVFQARRANFETRQVEVLMIGPVHEIPEHAGHLSRLRNDLALPRVRVVGEAGGQEIREALQRVLSNTEIAAQRFVSEDAVKSHINLVFTKIGARDRAQAVSYAYRRRL